MDVGVGEPRVRLPWAVDLVAALVVTVLEAVAVGVMLAEGVVSFVVAPGARGDAALIGIGTIVLIALLTISAARTTAPIVTASQAFVAGLLSFGALIVAGLPAMNF